MKKHAQAPSPEEKFITRRDLAERHRVSQETLKRREKSGLLKAIKVGRLVRYRLSDIHALEASWEAN